MKLHNKKYQNNYGLCNLYDTANIYDNQQRQDQFNLS
jgi:hypothetical protein